MQQASSSDDELARARRTRKWIYAAIPIAFVLSAGYLAVNEYYQLAFNVNESLEGKVFYIDKGRLPERGDYVSFVPPRTALYPGDYRFMKVALGTEGDSVEVRGQDVMLNGKYIGTAKKKSTKGLPLTVTSGGVVPKDHYFVWTPHFSSFDSRYAEIGWIHKDRVIGTAYRIY